MIVGRAGVLARLDQALDDASGGCATRLLVTGEPGIGKTTLLGHATETAGARGLHVLRATSLDGDQELPYATLSDLVRSAGPLPDLVASHRHVLDQLSEGAPGLAPARVGAALLELLGALSESAAALVCLDDLHWADPPSRRALVLAAGRLLAEPVLVLAASWTVPPSDTALLTWPRLEVPPLGPAESIALLLQVSAGRLPVRVARRIAEAMGGNPLALSDCVTVLPAEVLAGQAPLPDPLPTGEAVQTAYADSMARLPRSTQQALLVLAVVGTTRWDLATQVLGRFRLRLEDLGPAVHSGLLTRRPDGGLDFRHPEVRGVCCRRADPARLQATHRQAALAAHQLGLGTELVVSHLSRATTGPDEHAASFLQDEASRAQRSGDNRAATVALEAAARLSPDPVRRTERAMRAVWIRDMVTGDYSGSGPLLALLDGAHLSPEDTAALRWLRADVISDTDLTGSLALLLDLAEDAARLDPTVAAVILWDLVISAQNAGAPQACTVAAHRLQEVLSRLRTVPADLVGVDAAALGSAAIFEGRVSEGVPLVAAARQALTRVDDAQCLPLNAWARLWLLDGLVPVRDPDWDARVRRQKDRNIQENPAFLAWVRGWEAERARWQGRLHLAAAYAVEAVEMSTEFGMLVSALHGRSVGMMVSALTGADMPSAPERAALREQFAAVGVGWDLARLDRAEGLVAMSAGDLDTAMTRFTSCADAGFAGRGPGDTAMPALVDLVEACERAGDHPAALARMPQLTRWLEPMPDGLSAALLARARALVSTDPDEADSQLGTALAAHRCVTEPYEQARTHLVLGEHLRRTRRRSAARQELRAALAGFDRIGARPWAELARAELRACGGRQPPHEDIRPSTQRLTPQEQRVAESVAEGHSNREVAAALFLSPRTVEFHLSSAYRKLGVTNRTALARALRRA